MSERFDLLGDPIPDNWGGRGRPPHVPTHENRNKVRLLLGLGWKIENIAKALRITKPTLRKHYFSELKYSDEAKFQLRATHLEILWEQAKGGNVAAAKEFRRLMDRAEAEEADQNFRDGASKATAKPATPRLGKKEAAAEDAKTAGLGTDWGEDLIGTRTIQ